MNPPRYEDTEYYHDSTATAQQSYPHTNQSGAGAACHYDDYRDSNEDPYHQQQTRDDNHQQHTARRQYDNENQYQRRDRNEQPQQHNHQQPRRRYEDDDEKMQKQQPNPETEHLYQQSQDHHQGSQPTPPPHAIPGGYFRGRHYIPPTPSPLNGPYCQGGISNYDRPSPYFTTGPVASPYVGRYDPYRTDGDAGDRAYTSPYGRQAANNSPYRTPPANHIPSSTYQAERKRPAPPEESVARYQQGFNGVGMISTTVNGVDHEGKQPNDYMCWSILNCLCCCMVLGIAAIYMSNRTQEAKFRGKTHSLV